MRVPARGRGGRLLHARPVHDGAADPGDPIRRSARHLFDPVSFGEETPHPCSRSTTVGPRRGARWGIISRRVRERWPLFSPSGRPCPCPDNRLAVRHALRLRLCSSLYFNLQTIEHDTALIAIAAGCEIFPWQRRSSMEYGAPRSCRGMPEERESRSSPPLPQGRRCRRSFSSQPRSAWAHRQRETGSARRAGGPVRPVRGTREEEPSRRQDGLQAADRRYCILASCRIHPVVGCRHAGSFRSSEDEVRRRGASFPAFLRAGVAGW